MPVTTIWLKDVIIASLPIFNQENSKDVSLTKYTLQSEWREKSCLYIITLWSIPYSLWCNFYLSCLTDSSAREFLPAGVGELGAGHHLTVHLLLRREGAAARGLHALLHLPTRTFWRKSKKKWSEINIKCLEENCYSIKLVGLHLWPYVDLFRGRLIVAHRSDLRSAIGQLARLVGYESTSEKINIRLLKLYFLLSF